MKRLAILLELIILLSCSVHPQPVEAESSITVSNDKILSDYPNKLTFQLSANSSADIQNISLLYRTNGATCQSAIAEQTIQLTPAVNVDAQWEWDFTISGVLPPGAEVYWQWEITDAVGNTLLTDEKTYLVNDTRNDWKQLTSGQVTLQWYEGNNTFGQTLLGIATHSLERMASNAGIRPVGKIWITIYPTTEKLLEVDIHASEWAGGIAYPEYNSSIMAIAPDVLEWASSVIPHELAHLVTQALVFNCQGMWLPTWLSEGLAVYAEGETSPNDHQRVTSTLDNDSLPPLRTLESGFSSVSEEANLSYAQSGMVVTYMIDEYGSQKMSDLLASIKDGNKIDKALGTVYGEDTDGIEAAWRVSLGYAPQPTQVPINTTYTSVPTMALWTSAVRASSTPTIQPSAPQATQTETPSPVPSPSLASPTPMPATQDPINSKGITSLYIIVLAIVSVIIVFAAIIILVLVARKRRISS